MTDSCKGHKRFEKQNKKQLTSCFCESIFTTENQAIFLSFNFIDSVNLQLNNPFWNNAQT